MFTQRQYITSINSLTRTQRTDWKTKSKFKKRMNREKNKRS